MQRRRTSDALHPTMGYLPIALNLQGRRCLIVGGGRVAARRAESLLEAGGLVTVVAPELEAALNALAEEGRIEIRQTEYQASHLDGASLVIAATNQSKVNAAVVADARNRGILCNSADSPDQGDFLVPSILRRGDLLLAVTTGGDSPALAARIRDELAALYGPEYAEYAALLGEARVHAMQTIQDPNRRRAVLHALAKDETTLALIRAGRSAEARAKALSCISSSSD